MQSFLTSILAGPSCNLAAVRNGLAHGVRRHVIAPGGRHVKQATVDIDGLPNKVDGKQDGADNNSEDKKTVEHRLVVSLSVAVARTPLQSVASTVAPSETTRVIGGSSRTERANSRPGRLNHHPKSNSPNALPGSAPVRKVRLP